MGCDVALVALLIFYPDFNPRAPCGVRRRDPYPENRGGGISIHAPLAGRDRKRLRSTTANLFQSTHPLRGATIFLPEVVDTLQISIHAPLAGCDGYGPAGRMGQQAFQSTHPLRGATLYGTVRGECDEFQSTHPLRGATPGCFD